MGGIFSSVELFTFSRDIVVCIIIQLEKLNPMKAYQVVYTDEGNIRGFFFRYRSLLKQVFQTCRAHLMAQSLYLPRRLNKNYHPLCGFLIMMRHSQYRNIYCHFEPNYMYYTSHAPWGEYVHGVVRPLVVDKIGLCIVCYSFGPSNEALVVKIDELKHHEARLVYLTDKEKILLEPLKKELDLDEKTFYSHEGSGGQSEGRV